MIKKLCTRVGLMVFGILLALLSVEVSFRIAGTVLSLEQEIKNQRNLTAKGAYRILCLGESTTQGQWPPFLEDELNEQGKDLKFKVIDKGRKGDFTGDIVSRLERNLEVFKPQMVVVMMGINDGEWVWKNPLEYENTPSIKWSLFLKNLRLNKLAVYILEGLKNIKAEMGNTGQGKSMRWIASAKLYQEKGDYKEALRLYNKSVRNSPQIGLTYVQLGELYLEMNDPSKATEAYEAGIKAAPKYPWTYSLLGEIYSAKKEMKKAEDMYQAGIKAGPDKAWTYIYLGRFYLKNHDLENARKTFEAGITNAEKSQWIYYELGNLYRQNGEPEKTEKLYKTAINTDPKITWLYTGLAKFYLDEGERRKAEKILTEGYATVGDVPQTAGALSAYYIQQGRKDFIDVYDRASYPPIQTIRNYQKLRDLVLKKNIKLVCMQYPMRDDDSLKRILGTDRGIIYVENKKNFAEALRVSKLSDLFVDMFAGDFGHCTPMGNKLIAENLSRVILQSLHTSSDVLH